MTAQKAIREECARQKISQNQLAKAIGGTSGGVSLMLNGRHDTRFTVILRMLGALGKDLAWLHAQGVVPEKAERPVGKKRVPFVFCG